MRWCFENTTTAYAENVLQEFSYGNEALVPVLWLYEVGSVLAKARRAGNISQQKASDFLEVLKALPILIDREGIDLILIDVHRLAVTYGITGYDAAYLELALRKNLPLATLDDELSKACQKAGGSLYLS
jgi:predicted nucleic acid-binding protein